MNSMSLVKVTVGIVLATAATFFVNANEVIPDLGEVNSDVEMEVKKELPSGKVLISEDETFAELLAQYDTDNDGSLNETELLTSDNEALKIAFKKLDANEDLAISLQEFTAFTDVLVK